MSAPAPSLSLSEQRDLEHKLEGRGRRWGQLRERFRQLRLFGNRQKRPGETDATPSESVLSAFSSLFV